MHYSPLQAQGQLIHWNRGVAIVTIAFSAELGRSCCTFLSIKDCVTDLRRLQIQNQIPWLALSVICPLEKNDLYCHPPFWPSSTQCSSAFSLCRRSVLLKMWGASLGAHNPKRATIMYLCHGGITDQFIFRTSLVLIEVICHVSEASHRNVQPWKWYFLPFNEDL